MNKPSSLKTSLVTLIFGIILHTSFPPTATAQEEGKLADSSTPSNSDTAPATEPHDPVVTTNEGGNIVGNVGAIPDGAVPYTRFEEGCGTIFFGFRNGDAEIWQVLPDDWETRYEKTEILYRDLGGHFHEDRDDCVLSNLWINGTQFAVDTLESNGRENRLPTIISVVVLLIGFMFVLRSSLQPKSNVFGFDSDALTSLKKVINYQDNASGVTSATSLNWLQVLVSQMERLDREDKYYVKRVRLLQGIALVLLGLAIAVLSRSAAIVVGNGVPNFATSFVITVPFALLLVSAGYLTSQSNRALDLRSKIRGELNEAQLSVVRGLAIVTSQIDVEKIFQKSMQKKDSEREDEQPIVSEKELAEKAKDLAKILAYWHKFGM